MRFGHLEIGVANPFESMAFYRDVLGFTLVQNQGDRFIWMERGGLEVLLLEGEGSAVYYSDRLEEEVRALHERGLELEKRGGCYHFRDPDGNEFQLVDPGGDHSGG